MMPPSKNNFLEWLISPSRSITDEVARDKSRLLAVVLGAMGLIFGGLDMIYVRTLPGYEIPWYGYLLLLVAFSLNRAGYYQLAAPITLAMFPMVIFSDVLLGRAPIPQVMLNFSVISIMLGSILLSRRGVLTLAVIEELGILATPFIIPQTLNGLGSVAGPAATLAIATVLAFVFINQRDRLERHHQSELRRGKERLDLALQASNLGTWDWDILTDAVKWSENVESILGLRPGEFKGTYDSYLAVIPAEEREVVVRAVAQTLNGPRDDYNVVHRISPKDGIVHWIEGNGKVYRDQDARPIRMTGTVKDISEQKQAQTEREILFESIQKRNAHLRTAALVSKYCNSILDPEILIGEATNLIADGFELYYVGLFLIAGDWAILNAGSGASGIQMVNDGYRLALDEHSMIGWSIQRRTARIAQQAEGDHIRFNNPFLPETRSEMAVPLISRDKVIGALTFQSRVSDSFSEDDIAILQTMSDQLAIAIENARLFSELQSELSQRKLAETEREALIQALEQKNVELERFTYTVSHDLKSPLITIRGFLGHLLDDAKNGDHERMESDARRISDATTKMQRLLDELLELSRVGRIVNQPEDVPFEILVREALSLVEGRIALRKIRVQLAGGLPTIRVDRVRMSEALQNLLDNASKFMGQQADPVIEIGFQESESGPIFFVRDNGMGIDPKFHQKIFGLFDKLDPASEGTGVGLALVKRIIEVHGGKIWVDSAPGQGSTFFFTLPTETFVPTA